MIGEGDGALTGAYIVTFDPTIAAIASLNLDGQGLAGPTLTIDAGDALSVLGDVTLTDDATLSLCGNLALTDGGPCDGWEHGIAVLAMRHGGHDLKEPIPVKCAQIGCLTRWPERATRAKFFEIKLIRFLKSAWPFRAASKPLTQREKYKFGHGGANP